jgi:hypothetical protein
MTCPLCNDSGAVMYRHCSGEEWPIACECRPLPATHTGLHEPDAPQIRFSMLHPDFDEWAARYPAGTGVWWQEYCDGVLVRREGLVTDGPVVFYHAGRHEAGQGKWMLRVRVWREWQPEALHGPGITMPCDKVQPLGRAPVLGPVCGQLVLL